MTYSYSRCTPDAYPTLPYATPPCPAPAARAASCDRRCKRPRFFLLIGFVFCVFCLFQRVWIAIICVSCLSYPVRWHDITLPTLITAFQCSISMSWFRDHKACISPLIGLKDLHRHWVCWMPTGRKNSLTLLEPRSRFGDKPLKF